jgi:hypothetical protein
MPRGATPGEPGPNGCPTVLLDGTIQSVDQVENQLVFLSAEGEQSLEMKVTPETRFRIPGVKKDAAKAGGLSKVPAKAPAKVRFCIDSGRLLEVKVKKEKNKSTT